MPSRSTSRLPANFPKCYQHLAEAALAQRWEITKTRGNHFAWRPPAGRVVFSPATPSDARGVYRVISKLRRAGLVLPGRE